MTPFARLALLALCTVYVAALAAAAVFVSAAVAAAATVGGIVLAVVVTLQIEPSPPKRELEGLSRRDVAEIVKRG